MSKIDDCYMDWFENWAEFQHTGAISKPAVWVKKRKMVWPVVKFLTAFALIYLAMVLVMTL